MYDFACEITASEIFPSLAFSFKPLDPTVLVHHLLAPECVKHTIGWAIYSVTRIFSFVGHDEVVPDPQWPSQYHNAVIAFAAQSPTLNNCCVRFAMVVTSHDATLATRRALPPT
jgi:hypothetical protein